MDVNFDQLQAFVAAAECGSFSAAARHLGKVQSAVSSAVANLEIDTGLMLFDRRGRYPKLTEHGEVLLRDARLILSRCTEFQNRAHAMAEDVDARIRLVVDEIMPHRFLVAVLNAFHHRYPETELEVLYGTLSDIQAMVQQDRADVGVLVPLSHPEQSVQSRLITYMPFYPVVAAGHPLAARPVLSAADLASYRQLVVTSRGGERELEEVIFSSCPWMLESTPLILDLVRQGVGFAFLPRFLVAQEVAQGTLVRLPLPMEKEPHTIPVYLLWASGRPLGKAGQWLLEQLSQMDCNA